MEMNQPSSRIHPLMAGAAVSVMLVSLLGVAAITGVLPTSHGSVAPAVAAMPAPPMTTDSKTATTPMAASVQSAQYAPDAEPAPVVHRRHTVHHAATVTAQAEPVSHAPAYQQPAPAPAAQNSAVGIGVGAVIGGLLGNQVGGGNGRTLATIAGAVGGGYVGNEVAKRNP